MKTIASACGFAFARCMKFYLFSMLPAVWCWFPVLFMAEYFDKKKGTKKMEIGWIKGFCCFGWYNNHIDYWELCLGKIFIAKK